MSTYQVPLPVLRGVLGRPPAARQSKVRADGSQTTVWSCGCSAHFRNSAHQTARWVPCKQHRGNFGQPVPPVRPLTPVRLDWIARRLGPRFCIVDAALNVICQSPDAEADGLLARARTHIMDMPAGTTPALIPFGDDALLRIVPFSAQWPAAFAIFVERVSDRGSLQSATGRFGLSRRELEVLRLILASRTNADIGRELFIAESTVGDHVKNLFRKTGCSKRTELLTRIFQDD